MLNRERLILAIDIQARSYKLLRWVGTAIENGLMPVEKAARHSDDPGAAVDWVTQNYNLLPPEVQPAQQHVREFANFFWTYITSSFDVVEQPGTRRKPGACGCLCPLCARITNAPHLQAKKLSAADKRRAIDLMTERVAALAEEESIVVEPDHVRDVVANEKTRRLAGFSAFGCWLINRLGGYTDGPAVLALWREIAWNRKGSPIQGFKLQYEDFQSAEEALIRIFRNVA